MAENPLVQVRDEGQSIWLDYLRRRFIACGDLETLIREDGLRGQTSNPQIFAKAISGSDDYDEQLRELALEGVGVEEIYETLAVEDIRRAADVFAPVFEASGGDDGYVSIEVSPHLAHDTEGTLEEVRRLAERIDRANVMIKIPATPEGIPAIETAIAEGYNVNVTLLFSVDTYRGVAEAYLGGLERLVDAGGDPSGVASVASFFLSRIDVLVDDLLGDRIRAGDHEDRAAELQGQVAIANARTAYQAFREIFAGERWEALRERGARVQRLLWASTSTKNPLYSDVRYVESLIGPDTVNTLPRTTLATFRDHGRVERTVDRNPDEAREVLEGLGEVGIDLDRVCDQLLAEGVQKFADPFDELMAAIASERERVLEGGEGDQQLRLGELGEDVEGVADALDERRFAKRLWAKDASLWSDEAAERRAIVDRLGWLDVVEAMLDECEPACRFGASIRQEDLDHVVLLGMGGSSLCPYVCSRIFGVDDFLVLDSTVPAAIREVEERVDPSRTLFLVASKSGTTTETRALADHFFDRTREALEEEVASATGGPGDRFVAITDPGTPLEELAGRRGFRRVWLTPPDIGGRYSALSYFGLVPMELMGIDARELLSRAYGAMQSSAPEVPTADNPAIALGISLARAAQRGRDKVTFLASSSLRPFGAWVEQLLAESTGKDGLGLVPVHGEPVGPVEAYGDDRIFVVMRLEEESRVGDDADGSGREASQLVAELAEAGHPVVDLELDDRLDLGAEFLRWEIATATAGAILEINPFDEPNVQESKDRTRELLERVRKDGTLPEPEPDWRGEGVAVFSPGAGDDRGARDRVAGGAPDDLAGWLGRHLGAVGAGDYVAIQAFLRPDAELERRFASIRAAIRDRLGAATTFGWGPRYLHSTGQLHKGGPDSGVFLLITAEERDDVDVPGADHSFATLVRAQALGDLQALADRGRRVLRLHLDEVSKGMTALDSAVESSLAVEGSDGDQGEMKGVVGS